MSGNKNEYFYINIFVLSVYMNIIYAFLPIVRCFPYVVKLGWKLFPVILVIFCILQVKDGKLFFQAILIFLFAFFLSVVRVSANCNATEDGLMTTLAMSILYWLAMIQGLYAYKYLSKKSAFKIIKFVFTVLFISSVTTIIGNIMQPGITRYLMHSEDAFSYYVCNIGGYGYIYGLACCVPYLIYMIKKDMNIRKLSTRIIIWFTTLIVSMLCLIISEFMTAIAIGCIGLLALLKAKNMKYFIMWMFIIAAAMICISSFGVEFLKVIADYINKLGFTDLYERVDGIYVLLSTGASYGDVYARMYLYRISWKHFIKNPLFGLMGTLGILNQSGVTPNQLIILGTGANISVGRHSDFIDLLGGGGLAAVIPTAIVLWSYIKKNIQSTSDEIAKICILVGAMQYIAYGFFDHAFSNFEVGLSVFLMPVLVVIAYQPSKDNNCRNRN